jgi:hypothetical protein
MERNGKRRLAWDEGAGISQMGRQLNPGSRNFEVMREKTVAMRGSRR